MGALVPTAGPQCPGGVLRDVLSPFEALWDARLASESLSQCQHQAHGPCSPPVPLRGKENVSQPSGAAAGHSWWHQWPGRPCALSQVGLLQRCGWWHRQVVPTTAGGAAPHPENLRDGSLNHTESPKEATKPHAMKAPVAPHSMCPLCPPNQQHPPPMARDPSALHTFRVSPF